MALALSCNTLTPRLRRPLYENVRLSSVRTPLRTRLLNGHETNSRFGSRRTTSMLASSRRTYLAAVAPPQPPPITTTRRADLGMKSPLVVMVAQPEARSPGPPSSPSIAAPPEVLRNVLRVNPVMASPFAVDASRSPCLYHSAPHVYQRSDDDELRAGRRPEGLEKAPGRPGGS